MNSPSNPHHRGFHILYILYFGAIQKKQKKNYLKLLHVWWRRKRSTHFFRLVSILLGRANIAGLHTIMAGESHKRMATDHPEGDECKKEAKMDEIVRHPTPPTSSRDTDTLVRSYERVARSFAFANLLDKMSNRPNTNDVRALVNLLQTFQNEPDCRINMSTLYPFATVNCRMLYGNHFPAAPEFVFLPLMVWIGIVHDKIMRAGNAIEIIREFNTMLITFGPQLCASYDGSWRDEQSGASYTHTLFTLQLPKHVMFHILTHLPPVHLTYRDNHGQHALFAYCGCDSDVFSYFYANGVRPTDRDAYGNTILHVYAQTQRLLTLVHLLQSDMNSTIDWFIANRAGYTPLAVAENEDANSPMVALFRDLARTWKKCNLPLIARGLYVHRVPKAVAQYLVGFL
jgi:hypothetical protein